MGLSMDDFAAASRRKTGCGVVRVLDALDPKDRTVLVDALTNPDVRHSAIETVLKNNGIDLNAEIIGRHRRGRCSCGR